MHNNLENGNWKRTLVTSALPYANGYLHLGHVAGAYLPPDIYVRFLRLNGEDVLHVSGSDEHGVPITISADEQGKTPQEIADHYHEANERAFAELGIDFDIYGRTTWKEHHATAREFFSGLNAAGYLTEKEEQQFYDPEAGKFLPDRYVEGTCPNCGNEKARGDQCDNCSATYNQVELISPISKITGKTPELRSTKHAYIKLGEFQARLETYVESHRSDWREHVLQQSRSWLKMGLGDRAITRDLNWGVDVPLEGYEKKKLYVWFDAPFGYITNTKALYERKGEPEEWRKWWQDPETRYCAFIGKDNIVFHTLIFPAMLMGYNEYLRSKDDGDGEQYIIPDNVPACEFLNLEGAKFSKSLKWGVDLQDYLAEFEPDPLRYVLAANMPENKDSDFTWKEYEARVNNELADILGNFVNRATTFVSRYFDGVLPPLITNQKKQEELRSLLSEDLRRVALDDSNGKVELEQFRSKYMKYLDENDLRMLLVLIEAPEKIGRNYRAFRFREALLETMNVARAANNYFHDSEPWATRKNDLERCGRTLNICMQVVRSLAILFQPVLPFTSDKLWKLLNLGEDDVRTWESASELLLKNGAAIGEPVILFDKVDDDVIEKEIAKLGTKGSSETDDQSGATVALKPEVTFEDVTKLDLRVATVVKAEKVKKSHKLLKLDVRIGDLERQIVAGIAKGYGPEDVVGKKIVVVANLKSATLMGVESQGMLLAANSPDDKGTPPILVTIQDDVPDGFEVR